MNFFYRFTFPVKVSVLMIYWWSIHTNKKLWQWNRTNTWQISSFCSSSKSVPTHISFSWQLPKLPSTKIFFFFTFSAEINTAILENYTRIKNKWEWNKQEIPIFLIVDKQETENNINGAFNSIKMSLLVELYFVSWNKIFHRWCFLNCAKT